MSKTVSLYDAKTSLSSLVEEAAAGAEIVIAKNGKPRARLVPLETRSDAVRQAGLFRGKVWMAGNFDDPLPEDLEQAFSGRSPDDPLNDPPAR